MLLRYYINYLTGNLYQLDEFSNVPVMTSTLHKLTYASLLSISHILSSRKNPGGLDQINDIFNVLRIKSPLKGSPQKTDSIDESVLNSWHTTPNFKADIKQCHDIFHV